MIDQELERLLRTEPRRPVSINDPDLVVPYLEVLAPKNRLAVYFLERIHFGSGEYGELIAAAPVLGVNRSAMRTALDRLWP